jgi:predicted Zn finger-like uncharacterized protein
MRFVCDSCRAQYMISDDKIGAKGVKIRCKKCGHLIVVRPVGAAAPKDEAPAPPEAPAAVASTAAASGNAAGGLASLGTPPEGGLFNDVEEDEIGAVFDQVLSGTPKMAAGEAPAESKSSTPAAVRKLAEAEAEADESKAPLANDWYVAIDEKQVGPLSVEKVKEHWERGEVGPDSLCWRQGFGDWIPLSEVAQLASVLSPRAPKPVIVAPAAVSGTMPAVSAPVESAFSAGGTAKNTRPEIPAAPMLGQEPPSSGWKPSAASVLASLVKEENEAMAKPAPKPVEEKPSAPGLLDLPPPEPAMAPAARAAPMMAAAEPMRAPQPAPMYAPAPQAYAQPQPAYAQPQPAYAGYPQPAYQGYPSPAATGPQGGGNKTMMAVGIAVAAVLLLSVGGYFAFGRSTPQPTPPPVAVADARPPPPVARTEVPVPAPEVKAPPAATPPAATPAPGTAPAVAATPPAAVVTPPAPAAVPPAADATATKPPPSTRPEQIAGGRERTGSRTGSNSREPRTEKPEKSESVGSASPPTKTKPDDGVGDDFDDLFGPKKTEKKPSNSQSAPPSTYIPPEPGGGSNVQEKLGQSDIMAVVVANKPAIMKCVGEQKKKDPGVTGRLVMRWTIQTNGRTTGVAVKSDEFKKTYMASCVSGLIKGWTFPKHRKQGDPIDFPFIF